MYQKIFDQLDCGRAVDLRRLFSGQGFVVVVDVVVVVVVFVCVVEGIVLVLICNV